MLAPMPDLAEPMLIARLQPQESAVLPPEFVSGGELRFQPGELRILRALQESEFCPKPSPSNRAFDSELDRSTALQAEWECATANKTTSVLKIAADKFRGLLHRRNWIGSHGVFLRGDELCIERDGAEVCPGERK